jgi:hypothetical protein
MGNWIDELDSDTKEYDRKVKAGAKQYDKELCNPKWEGWNYDEDDDNDDED